ncbi:MAG: hypothetical protein EBS01_11075 [Verrucomicrobia bacterium]|nr:hypothetical protein [Verrucomicrobiota bacterium]
MANSGLITVTGPTANGTSQGKIQVNGDTATGSSGFTGTWGLSSSSYPNPVGTAAAPIPVAVAPGTRTVYYSWRPDTTKVSVVAGSTTTITIAP